MRKIKVFILPVMLFITVGAGIFGGDPDPKSFSLYFDKPATNTFDFVTPDDTTKAFSGAFEFPFPSDKKKFGYSSSKRIGISYDLETRGTLEVFCNSSSTHSDDYRLRSKTVKDDDGNYLGLNYMVGVGATISDADNHLKGLKGYADFGGNNITDIDAKAPVVTIYSGYSKAESGNADATHIYNNTGVVILSMIIRSPKGALGYESYFEGQYSGYIQMVYTTVK